MGRATTTPSEARGGDTTSTIFDLRTQAGWRETPAVEHDLAETGDGGPREVRDRSAEFIDHVTERQRQALRIVGDEASLR